MPKRPCCRKRRGRPPLPKEPGLRWEVVGPDRTDAALLATLAVATVAVVLYRIFRAGF